MASDVEVVNLALTLLGEARIMSLDDDVKPAREAKAIFTIVRDALLSGYNWSFAKTRALLPALADVPPFEFSVKYQLPSDCLRIVMAGEFYVGIDLTDYRGSPVEEYTIEGRELLCNWSAPLQLKYIRRITDGGQFSANFTKAFGCQLAADLTEPLSQSNQKREAALKAFDKEISLAIRANAIELPPQKMSDDEWIISRR